MNTREAETAMINRKFPETRMRRLRRTDGWSAGCAKDCVRSDAFFPVFPDRR
ncbi:MAG: hypothetical protein CM15mP21_7450 [Hyphomicrobiales bacterium]|nr:MAG: hypothetical protein CM15mP21_7450 [Hyphomicrobiales bacterium]